MDAFYIGIAIGFGVALFACEGKAECKCKKKSALTDSQSLLSSLAGGSPLPVGTPKSCCDPCAATGIAKLPNTVATSPKSYPASSWTM